MSFDEQSVGGAFEVQKRELEGIYQHIQECNDMLRTQQFIGMQSMNQLKQQMKGELQRIKQLVQGMEKSAKGDQKFQLKVLKQQITKQEEIHKQIVRDLVKQSLVNSFNRLSLADTQGRNSQQNSQGENYFVEPPKPEAASAQFSQKSFQTQKSRKSQLLEPRSQKSESEMSVQTPLTTPLMDDQDKRESSDSGKRNTVESGKRNTDDYEAQAAKQLNEQLVEETQLEQYNKELDDLINFEDDKNKSKCLKISIISAIVALLVIVIVFIIIYFVVIH